MAVPFPSVDSSYRLSLEITLESNAKLLRIFRTRSILLGESFSIFLRFRNIGRDFPGGQFDFSIAWRSGQGSRETYKIPGLKPGEEHDVGETDFEALSEGCSLIVFNGTFLVKDEEGTQQLINFCQERKEILPRFGTTRRSWHLIKRGESIAIIKVKTHEEIYTFWGMMISAVGLLTVALEKVLSLLKWL